MQGTETKGDSNRQRHKYKIQLKIKDGDATIQKNAWKIQNTKKTKSQLRFMDIKFNNKNEPNKANLQSKSLKYRRKIR
jgi:hypothetical protein